jgi:threonine dehydratase
LADLERQRRVVERSHQIEQVPSLRRMLSRAELDEVMRILRPHVPATPAYRWPLLEAATGCRTWVKHENATPTGAFKVRGGLVYGSHLLAAGPVRGLITATRGNHGQSIAFAGRVHSVPVTVVVPKGNSPDKNAAMAAWGAEIVVHGRDFQEAREHMLDLAANRGLVPVPSFHRDLVAGVATYAAELHEQATELDVVYVPVGQGSGICANIVVRDLLGRRTEVVGVVAEGAPAHALSFSAGRPVATPTADTFVDGVATRTPDADAVEVMVRGAARFVRVSDSATMQAMRMLCPRL